jgi:hypothetical protein
MIGLPMWHDCYICGGKLKVPSCHICTKCWHGFPIGE